MVRHMNYSVAMVQLPLVREASGETVKTPADVARICADMIDLIQESFHVLTLDAKNRLINRHLVTLGLVNASLAHPREVFRPALLDGASAIVAVHNHPSGDPTPSAEDIRITRQLVEAGRILDVPLADHVILGRATESRSGVFSIREHGLCDFTRLGGSVAI